MFTFDDAEATVAYAFADAIEEDIAEYVTIENGMLKVSNQLTKKFLLMMKLQLTKLLLKKLQLKLPFLNTNS